MIRQTKEAQVLLQAQAIMAHVKEARYMMTMQEKFCNGDVKGSFDIVREYLGLSPDA